MKSSPAEEFEPNSEPAQIEVAQNLSLIRAVSVKDNLPERALKRAIDIIFSSIGLVVLLPLLPIVALAIRLDSRGGVFFIQQRIGLNNEPFQCWKFRTMKPEKHGFSSSNEHRITTLGMMLRLSHFDELPQLWNVLRGDMSLVGPRPHMISDHKRFIQLVPNYAMRHHVKPGITGLAQSSGYFGHVDSIEHLKKRIQLDLDYVETWSARQDLKIILHTFALQFKFKRHNTPT